MKNFKLSLLAAAVAAVTLTGCEDGDVGIGNAPISITPANMEDVAADGATLVEGAMDAADEVAPDELPLGVAMASGNGPSGMRGGLTFIKVGEHVRESVEQAQLLSMADGLALPAGVVTEGTTVECSSGSYTYYNSYGGFGVTYNDCVFEESWEGGHWRSRYNGTATGSWYGGDTWYVNYENLRSQYDYTNSYGGGYFSRGDYRLNGQFSSYYTYDYGGGFYRYDYSANNLAIDYSYAYSGEGDYPGGEGSGNIVYDSYYFSFWWDGEQSVWSGQLQARDSARGAWGIFTVEPFGTNYCDKTATGEVVYSGGWADDDHHEARAGDDDRAYSSNVLHVIGDGTNIVRYDLYTADGSLISSRSSDWFGDYSYCVK